MDIFRKKTSKVFFAIFASFFMGVFGFGVFQFFNNPNNIASVGSEKIKLSSFLNSYNSLVQNTNAQLQQDPLIKKRALNQVIATNIIQQDAKNIGLVVSDAEVRELIVNTPSFISEEGEFEHSIYQNFLSNQGYSAADYEKNLKSNILYNKYLQLFFPIAKISDDLAGFLQTKYSKKSLIRYFQLPEKFWKTGFQISSSDLEDFYNNEQQKYRKPSVYSTNLFYIDKNKVTNNISEQSVASYLEKNKAEFTQRASFKSRHILISLDGVSSSTELGALKKKAYDIYEILLSDKSRFAELAKEHSQDPISSEQGGDLGWIEYDSFSQEFEDVVKQLAIGGISEPFITTLGYHIVYLEDQKEEVFDAPKAQEEVRLLLEKKQFDSFVAVVLQKLSETKSYSLPNLPQEKLVVDYNIDYIFNTSVTSDSEYKNISLQEIYDDLQKFTEENVNIFETAPYLNFYKFSEESTDAIIVYQLLDVNLGDKLPFEQVKQEVRADLESLESVKYTKAKVDELNKKYQTKDDFEKLTKEWKIANVKKANFVYAVPEASNFLLKLKNNSFQLKPEQLRFFADNNKLYSLLLDDFTQDTNPDFGSFDKENLELEKVNVLINKFINGLLRQSKISYNKTFLEQYNIPNQ